MCKSNSISSVQNINFIALCLKLSKNWLNTRDTFLSSQNITDLPVTLDATSESLGNSTGARRWELKLGRDSFRNSRTFKGSFSCRYSIPVLSSTVYRTSCRGCTSPCHRIRSPTRQHNPPRARHTSFSPSKSCASCRPF